MKEKLEYTRDYEIHTYMYKGKVLEDIQFITFGDSNILFKVVKTLDHRYTGYEVTLDQVINGKILRNGYKTYCEKALAVSADYYIQLKDNETGMITNHYLSDLVEKQFHIIPVRYKERKQ